MHVCGCVCLVCVSEEHQGQRQRRSDMHHMVVTCQGHRKGHAAMFRQHALLLLFFWACVCFLCEKRVDEWPSLQREKEAEANSSSVCPGMCSWGSKGWVESRLQARSNCSVMLWLQLSHFRINAVWGQKKRDTGRDRFWEGYFMKRRQQRAKAQVEHLDKKNT